MNLEDRILHTSQGPKFLHVLTDQKRSNAMCGSTITHKIREKSLGSQTLPNGSLVLQHLPEEAITRAFFARHCCIHYKTQESQESRGSVARNTKNYANSAKTHSGGKRRKTADGKRKTENAKRKTENDVFCQNCNGKSRVLPEWRRKTENGKRKTENRK